MTEKKKGFKWIWYAIWLIIALVGGGGTLFSWMPRTDAMFYGGCAMLIVSVLLGVTLLLVAKEKSWKQALITGAISASVYTGVLALVVYVCDEVLFKNAVADYQPVHSRLTIVVLNFILIVALCIFMPKKYDTKLVWLKRAVAAVLCIVALVLSGLPQNWWWGRYNYKVAATKWVTAPTGFSTYTEKETVLVKDADFYVAVDGDDNNNGSFEKPFATIEKAKQAVKEMDKTGKSGITVAIKAGEYSVTNIVFTEEDGGTKECPITYCAYGDGEVILNAGVTLKPEDFEAVSGAQADRLSEEAKSKVVYVDLSKYGISADLYKEMYAIGAYSTYYKYDGYTGGFNCELFVNDTRQVIARYPNEGWIQTGTVVDHGQPGESNDNPHVTVEGWEELRNPVGETYTIEKDLAERINSWDDIDSVWMYGYFTADWAPSSSPIGNFDYANLTLQNKFVSRFDTDGRDNYYFYNVFEELDAPGEWYLDRETGMLYMYASEDFAESEILLTLSTETMICMEDADYITLSGLTILGTKGDAIDIKGNGNTVEYCLIKNIAGTGIFVDGYNNLISSNEITRTGRGLMEIRGGDLETLTASDNRIYNNYCHHWGEVNGVRGIIVYGVGTQIDHNEFHDAIDAAIDYEGNNHIIEYNLCHDLCQESSDGGAIYCGRSWTDYGCIVRYNAIYNMGKKGFSTPNAIYLDDGQAGQQIYGNLIVNAPQNGIKVGGGRDNEVWGNIVINTMENGIYGIEGVYYGGMKQNVWDMLKPGWENSYKDTEIWQNAYPALAATFWDEAKADDPNFVANAANNKVNGNIVVNVAGELGLVEENQAQFSDFSGNAVYTMDMLGQIFVDYENGDYTLREDSIIYEILPDFEEIPVDKIGRE